MYGSPAMRKLYAIQTAYMFAGSFSATFMFLYMVQAGFSYLDIILYKVMLYTFALITLFSVRSYKSMRHIGFGFIGAAAILFILPFAKLSWHIALIGAVDGLTFPLFWIPYNTLYFSQRKGRESAFLAGILFMIPPLLGVVVPVIGGLVYDSAGPAVVFYLGALMFAVCGIYYGWEKGGGIAVHVKKAFTVGKGLRTLVFVQGYWQGVDWLCVPLVSLYFLTSGTSFGGFFAWLSLVGALSTLYFCRLSDRSGNRVNYLYPSLVMTSAATVMSAFTSDVVNWFVVRAIVGFFVAVSNPFTTSIVLDRVKNTTDAMYVREVMLNFGRLAGVASVVACEFLFGGFQNAFIPAGFILASYPLLVEWKSIYRVKVRVEALKSEEMMEFHD